MSFHSDAIKAGLGLVACAAGERVYYNRGDRRQQITAVPGTGERSGPQAEVVRVNGKRDWLIMVEELDFLAVGNRNATPEHSDFIEVDNVTYEVLPDDSGECYSDKVQCQYRVHTKVIRID